MKFATILKKLRKERHMTQDQLSKLLNVAKSTVSMYEQGERMPSFEIMESLANIFDVSIDMLYGRETESSKNASQPSIDELKLALFGGETEVTDEMWDSVVEYAAFLKSKYEKK